MSNRHSQARKRPQHQNTFAYKHNPNSKKTEKILSSPNEGVCHQCHEQIEWRKKFRKYKPLTGPKRCSKCNNKTVRLAYHILCQQCAEESGNCAKCTKSPIAFPYVVLGKKQEVDEEEIALSKMTERQRRTYLRELQKEEKENSSDDELRQLVKQDEATSKLKSNTIRKEEEEDDEEGSDMESFESDSDEIDKLTAEVSAIADKASSTNEDEEYNLSEDENEENPPTLGKKEQEQEDAGEEDDEELEETDATE